MRIRLLAVTAGLAMVLHVAGCAREDDRPITRQGGGDPSEVCIPYKMRVVVPDEARGKWSAVELAVRDKMSNKTAGMVVKLGSEYAIPGSGLKIKVGDFLSDFTMNGSIITSTSAELNNPAVHVVIFKGEEELFKGWLFSRYPDVHPFMHEKYEITLTNAVGKG